MSVTVTAFYKFVEIEDREGLRAKLLERTCEFGIKGTILVAHEGINSTISGSDDGIRTFLAWLRADPRFSDLVSKESYAPAHPFRRMKVKLKREIVTIGLPEVDPTKTVGTYVKPEDWNAIISDPDVVVLDTRNAYEVAIGTFKRAIDPGTRSFREFPGFVQANLDPARQRKVAMFCTGGIRCEKASSFMLQEGFSEVFHLEGGILKYLETVSPSESLWEGECYVFDERVALDYGVEIGTHRICRACGSPVPHDVEGCPRCNATGDA